MRLVLADLREPEKILSDPVTQETLDFTRPVALILAAVVHFRLPEDDPARIIGTLVDALLPGSYVVASHGSTEYGSQEEADVVLGSMQAAGCASRRGVPTISGTSSSTGLSSSRRAWSCCRNGARFRVAAPSRERGKSVPTQASPASRNTASRPVRACGQPPYKLSSAGEETCLMPASAVRNRTVRPRKARFSRGPVRADGAPASICRDLPVSRVMILPAHRPTR